MSPLRWAPPPQRHPVTIAVPAGFYSGSFAPDQDVTFIWPDRPRFSSFTVTGGRHLRTIGGTLVKTTAGTGLRFTDTTGSVFLEGLDLDMTAVSADAINVSGAPGALPDVYLQNLRVTGVNGSRGGVHADIFQPQGPIGDLRVDRLTGRSDYQGLFIPPQAPMSSAELHRVDLAYTHPDGSAVTYLLWLLDECSTDVPCPVTLDDVWVTPRAGQHLGQAVWPHPAAVDGDGARIGVRSSDGWRTAYWTPRLPVTGRVQAGSPPDGDFTPAGSVGLGYVSPGYL